MYNIYIYTHLYIATYCNVAPYVPCAERSWLHHMWKRLCASVAVRWKAFSIFSRKVSVFSTAVSMQRSSFIAGDWIELAGDWMFIPPKRRCSLESLKVLTNHHMISYCQCLISWSKLPFQRLGFGTPLDTWLNSQLSRRLAQRFWAKSSKLIYI